MFAYTVIIVIFSHLLLMEEALVLTTKVNLFIGVCGQQTVSNNSAH